MTKPRGHPVLGAISGLLFGFFLSAALTVFAGVSLDSVLYLILTIAGLVVGLGLGLTGPFHRRRTLSPAVPQPPARPQAPSEYVSSGDPAQTSDPAADESPPPQSPPPVAPPG